MPINAYLGILVFLLLAPCLLLDLWSLPANVQRVFKYGFSLIGLVAHFIFVAHIFWVAKEPARIKELVFYVVGFALFLVCGIIVTPWNLTLKIALFVGSLHMTALYGVNSYKYVTRSYHQHAIAIYGYIGIMVLFVVDWKTMSESFSDGTIRTTSFYNAVIFAGFLIFLLAVAVTRNIYMWRGTPEWNWRRAIKLDRPLYQYLIAIVPALIGLTLSAPYMYRDVLK